MKADNNIGTVCVYCASSTKIREEFFAAARELGSRFAKEGIRLVNGAGSLGLMAACSDACLEAGGEVTGVIPEFMIKEGWCHKNLTETIVTPDMHTRKQRMAQLSDGIIALPGGVGTFEELMEIITWKQLGIYLNPIVIFNVEGYFDPLLQMLQKAVDEQFMRAEHAAIWTVATSVDEAIEQLRTTPVWDATVRKNAAIR